MAFLDIRNMAISFGGIKALRGVSFQVPKGSIYSLIGPNGAGKTTIINCISGIYRPDAGEVLFSGKNLARMKPDRIARLGVSRTFQNIELFNHMTVLDNILLGRHRHIGYGILRGALCSILARGEELRHRRKAEEIIDFLDLQWTRDRFVGGLPFGVQKMVEIGRALAMEPGLLLLDEPTAGMNAEEKQDLNFWIRDIRDDLGITVILVEHDMRMVASISDRVLALNFGEKIAEGTAKEVQKHPEVLKAYLGEEEEEEAQRKDA